MLTNALRKQVKELKEESFLLWLKKIHSPAIVLMRYHITFNLKLF